MTLKFFGRGSGFSDEHTSAYFSTDNKELVIIDCPVSTFQKLKQLDLSKYKTFIVLITHTHGDHIGGLGLFIQYAFFTLKKTVNIIAPSHEVQEDLARLLKIEGNEFSWCNLTNLCHLSKRDWFGNCIPTKHSPQLEGKCFGYHLIIGNTDVVYTGDTSTLTPFLPYLTNKAELYVDTSVHYGMIHIKLADALPTFIELAESGVKIHLMHLDDVAAAEEIVKEIPNIEVVTVE